MATIRAGRVGVSLVVAFFATEASAQPTEPPAPPPALVEGIDLFGSKIFGSAVEIGKLPIAWAKPAIIRWKVRGWVESLPLPQDVRSRVLAKIDSTDFVDQVVPFLFSLKEQYTMPTGSAERTFDAFARQRLGSLASTPGIEHQLFRFAQTEKKPESSGKELDPGLAAGFVRFYDALFLAPGSGKPYRLGEPIDANALERTTPIVRDVLRRFIRQMEPGSENRKGLEKIAASAVDTEAIAASLVEVVRRKVDGSYRQFAGRTLRERDLDRWMRRELDRERGGELWAFLRHAREKRRFAVHVVVDGLEGRQVEALAKGEAGDPFLREVLGAHRSGPASPPAGVASRPAPAATFRFLERFVERGFRHPSYLPYFRSIFEHDANGVSSQGLSTTPTISVRNLPLAFTGAPVVGNGSTGVPNFHFVDRERDRAYYFYGNDALELDVLLSRGGARTLFDRLPLHLTLSGNGQYDSSAKKSFDGFVNLALGEASRDFGERLVLADLDARARAERKLDQIRLRLLGYEKLLGETGAFGAPRRAMAREKCRLLIRELAHANDDGMPDYLLLYDPWPDHFAHFHGPFSDELLSPTGELARLDFWLGKIDRAYRAAGVHDRTLFGMAGDHGLAPAFHLVDPEGVVFEALEKEGFPLEIEKISSDEGEGPRLTHPLSPPSMKGNDVVVASTAGGNYMIDLFFRDDARWRVQPVLSEIQAWPLAGGRSLDLVEELLSRLAGSLDYLVVRDERTTFDRAAVRVIGQRGGERAEARLRRIGDRIFYSSSGDLLDVRTRRSFATTPDSSALTSRCIDQAREADPATWCREDEWRALTAPTPRPDSVVQLAHLYDTGLAGTINLFAAPGIAFNSKVPGRHAGEAFEEKDAFVGFWGVPVARTSRLGPALGGSVPATLAEWLTGTPVVVGRDGWGFPSLLSEITRR